MENLSTLTLGEIVKQNVKAAAILEKFSLDFCCMGNQNFNDACKANNIDPTLVMNELQGIHAEQGDGVDFDTWPLDLLVDYICRRHHAYIEEKTPLLKGYLNKICHVHGSHHPELLEIRDLFSEIAGELTVHLKKEELMLFPFIKKLAKAKGSKVSSSLFGSVSNPVDLMKADHAAEGEKFRKISALANNYRIPADACGTFSITYQLLDEFEKDLHLHIHLENNILFAKAIRLEEQLNSSV